MKDGKLFLKDQKVNKTGRPSGLCHNSATSVWTVYRQFENE